MSPQHLASELFAGCYTVGTWYNDARSKKRWIILRPDLVGSLRDPTELITLQPLSLPVSGQLVQRKCNLVSRQSSTVNFGDFDQPWRVNRTANTASAWAGNPWAPTELGVELMRRLWGFTEATYVRVSTCDASWAPDYDAGKVAAADEAENATEALIDKVADAILDRPVTELSHLTDLALVQQARNDGYDPDPATAALIEAILRLAGVPKRLSSMDAVYEQVQQAHEAA